MYKILSRNSSSGLHNESYCGITTTSNSTLFFDIDPFGGIPSNLIINSIVFGVFLIIFLIFHKKAFRSVNEIIKHEKENLRMPGFSIRKRFERSSSRGVSGKETNNEEEPTREEKHENEVAEASKNKKLLRRRPLYRQGTETSMIVDDKESFSVSLNTVFCASDEEIFERCGDDALQYLRFQRYIICYLVILMIFSIGVILPLNLHGSNLSSQVELFEQTTIANLNPSDYILWVHLCVSFITFPIAIFMMRRFSGNLGFVKTNIEISKTIMVENIAVKLCQSTQEFARYFQESFEELVISDIRFAYDVEELDTVYNNLRTAKSAFNYCVKKERSSGNGRIDVYPKSCSRFSTCICCCFYDRQDGLSFYKKEVESLKEKFETEKEKSLSKPLGMAFITFETHQMAKSVHDQFNSFSLFGYKPTIPKTNIFVENEDNPKYWNVRYAPPPDDIYWTQLEGSRKIFIAKYILVNVVLFLVVLFLSTPGALLGYTNTLIKEMGNDTVTNIEEGITTIVELPELISSFIPTLIKLGYVSILPLIVSWSDRYLGHWTRSEENHSVMKKSFWLLVFTVIILPTFGSTSIYYLLDELKTDYIDGQTNTFHWDCIFVPDAGASFVNYVITAALIGCGFELMRFFHLFIYIFRICFSRSVAEASYIKNVLVISEFQFGEQYAKLLMILCMIVVYSMLCPLITPFGVLYFIIKHYTDRQNLIYGYKPSKISKKLHSTAIHYVVLCSLLLQFIMMVFFLIRNGLQTLRLISNVSIGIFLLSLNIYLAQLWSSTCDKLSPIDYLECNYIREDDLEVGMGRNDVYLPITLMTEDEKTSYRDYVSFKDSTRKSQKYGAIGPSFNKAMLLPKKLKFRRQQTIG